MPIPALCLAAFAADAAVELKTGPDRVKTPLKVELKRIGTIRPRATKRLWTAKIPVPPVKSARSGKPMRPCAKVTVLGGGMDVPILSVLQK